MKNPSKYLGNELNYFVKVLNSEKWSSTEGTWTGRLETEFAEKFKQEYAVAFNSGTSTMHAALLALGVKPGDEVISPAITVIMNTSTTIHAGAIPVYEWLSTEKHYYYTTSKQNPDHEHNLDWAGTWIFGPMHGDEHTGQPEFPEGSIRDRGDTYPSRHLFPYSRPNESWLDLSHQSIKFYGNCEYSNYLKKIIK